MLSSDITVAADDCRFSQLEVLRGIMPTGGATIRFVERAGWGDAMKYLLTGMEFNSEEAYRMRLVQEVVTPNMVFSKAKELAESIVSAAPLAVKETIRNSKKAQEFGQKAAVMNLMKCKLNCLYQMMLKKELNHLKKNENQNLPEVRLTL